MSNEVLLAYYYILLVCPDVLQQHCVNPSAAALPRPLPLLRVGRVGALQRDLRARARGRDEGEEPVRRQEGGARRPRVHRPHQTGDHVRDVQHTGCEYRDA